MPRGHDLRGAGSDRAHGNVNRGKDKDQSEDTASNAADDDAPTTMTVDLPPLDGDVPPMTDEQERAIIEAMLQETSPTIGTQERGNRSRQGG